MDESQIKVMNRSFHILQERRRKLLEDERTQELKDAVKEIREYSIKNLDKLVEIATSNLQKNGIEVFYAEDSSEALNTIYSILKQEKTVAKSKSNTAAEIGISEFLEDKGINVIETDLGDRIVQFTPQKRSSHPIGPASHLKIEDIAEILSQRFKHHVKAEPREILDLVREDVLEELSHSQVGITGANSLAAHDGSLLMVHNEGNISLVSMLDTHLVIVGIDKLVRTIEEAVSVVKLETIYASGKPVPAYMNVVSSPSKTADIEQTLLNNMYGARRVVVILLDNGRKKILQECPESLMCIGCGSCILSCPIYNAIGYEFGYRRHLGGRGVVLSNFIQDKRSCFQSGLFTCTLCGLCTIDCPVDIPTNQFIENLRKESVDSGLYQPEHGKIAQRIQRKGTPF